MKIVHRLKFLFLFFFSIALLNSCSTNDDTDTSIDEVSFDIAGEWKFVSMEKDNEKNTIPLEANQSLRAKNFTIKFKELDEVGEYELKGLSPVNSFGTIFRIDKDKKMYFDNIVTTTYVFEPYWSHLILKNLFITGSRFVVLNDTKLVIFFDDNINNTIVFERI